MDHPKRIPHTRTGAAHGGNWEAVIEEFVGGKFSIHSLKVWKGDGLSFGNRPSTGSYETLADAEAFVQKEAEERLAKFR